jgi:hypothetical protein
VSGQLEQLGIEANDIALSLEHGTFKIIVEQHTRHTSKELECLHVAAHEEGHRGAEEET